MSGEKSNYLIFFVTAIAIMSVAILIEQPESLASVMPLNEQDSDTG